MAQRFPDWSPLAVIVVAGLLAVAVGSWSWALLYGGFIHLGARIFRGREGWGETARAIGYALFWPGLIAAPAAAIVLVVDRVAPDAKVLLLGAVLVQVLAGFWGLYTVVAAVRAWHSFGWWRSIGSYVIGLLMFFLPVVVLVLLLRPSA